MKAAILTVSDRCSRGEQPDRSGELAKMTLESAGWEIYAQAVVPDEQDQIEAVLLEWIGADVALIITTGGTGFSQRDITPEATKAVIEREVPGLAELLRWHSYASIPAAVLSRGVAGICKRTLIVNLPGSTGGVRDGLELLVPLIPHAVGVLRDEPTDHPSYSTSSDNPPTQIETMQANIDDLSPEHYDLLMDRLFEAGALDVFITPIQMKKQRPAILITILCEPALKDRLADILFTNTSTLGLRTVPMHRITLKREWKLVETAYGPIRVKLGIWRGKVVTESPEYEDVKAAAVAHNAPLKLIYQAALQGSSAMVSSQSQE